MIAKNRYYKHSRIAEKAFRRVIRYFTLDFSASDTARLTGISVRSINAIYILPDSHIFNGHHQRPKMGQEPYHENP